MAPLQFKNTVSIHGILKTLWITVGVLVSIHVILNVIHYEVTELPWYLRQIFDVDEEDSFPTWYSASALLLTSVALWVNARAHRQAASRQRTHWYGLALGFLVLSIDEIAGMHETLNSIMDGSWAVPGAVVAALVGGIYLSFLGEIDRRTAIQFVIGGGVFIGGAVGVELYTEPYLENDELSTLAYNLWTGVEEFMEMAGVLIFLRALLKSMKANAPFLPLEIKLTD